MTDTGFMSTVFRRSHSPAPRLELGRTTVILGIGGWGNREISTGAPLLSVYEIFD